MRSKELDRINYLKGRAAEKYAQRAKLLGCDPDALSYEELTDTIEKVLRHLNGAYWLAKAKGEERDKLAALWLRLKNRRAAQAKVADQMYADWLEGPEWAALKEKGSCEAGKVHLRLARRIDHEAFLDDGRHYSVHCGRGNVTTKLVEITTPEQTLQRVTEFNRFWPEDMAHHHWLVERVDCKNCLKKLATHLAYQPDATGLGDYEPDPTLVGSALSLNVILDEPAQTWASTKPHSKVHFSFDPTLTGKAMYRQFPLVPAEFLPTAELTAENNPDPAPRKPVPALRLPGDHSDEETRVEDLGQYEGDEVSIMTTAWEAHEEARRRKYRIAMGGPHPDDPDYVAPEPAKPMEPMEPVQELTEEQKAKRKRTMDLMIASAAAEKAKRAARPAYVPPVAKPVDPKEVAARKARRDEIMAQAEEVRKANAKERAKALKAHKKAIEDEGGIYWPEEDEEADSDDDPMALI